MNSKRLTKHTPDGACLIINADNEQDARQELKKKFKEACNKLAELEDKLENGTLIEIPCKVFDTIYHVFNGKILEYRVEKFECNIEGVTIVCRGRRHFGVFDSCLVGKFIFFDKEQAEKALEGLK